MKWVLWILGSIAGLLVLCVAVLFFAGMRADAGHLHTAVEVAASPEQVWPWLNDADKLKQWVSWLVEVRGSVARTGDKRTLVMRDENNGGQLMEIESTAADYSPPSHLRMSLLTKEGFAGEQNYRVTDLGNGRSRIEIDSSYRFDMWFARLMEPLITKAAQHKMVGDSVQLKRLIDSAAVPAA